MGEGLFIQKFDLQGKPDIFPLVQFVACMQKLAYVDSRDRKDEILEISATIVDTSYKNFCQTMVQKFGPLYLN